jgi:hypothetical protein
VDECKKASATFSFPGKKLSFDIKYTGGDMKAKFVGLPQYSSHRSCIPEGTLRSVAARDCFR